jgi:hypothetical protein
VVSLAETIYLLVTKRRRRQVYISDELKEKSMTPDDNSSLPAVRSKSDDKPILESIDVRIANASDPREIVLWTKVREEIIRQNETMEEPRHRRRLENLQLYFKMSFSIIAFVTGVVLLVYGFIYLAPLIIGAGLFALAPEFVMAYLTKDRGEQNEQK